MIEWPGYGETRQGELDGPAGKLQLEAGAPEGEEAGIAVICHPHPQYGGTKDNKVVFTLARACRAAGLVSLRFNFRGVGDSGGSYDAGKGETEDALAVADWAAKQTQGKHLVWAGFSFGAAVALRAAMQRQPAGLLTVALPTAYFEQKLPRPDCPWLAVYGDADEVLDPLAAMQSLDKLKPAPALETFAGAGHFFHGRLTELGDVAEGHVSQWLAAARGNA